MFKTAIIFSAALAFVVGAHLYSRTLPRDPEFLQSKHPGLDACELQQAGWGCWQERAQEYCHKTFTTNPDYTLCMFTNGVVI